MNLNIRDPTLSVLRASFAIYAVKGFKPRPVSPKNKTPSRRKGFSFTKQFYLF